MLKMPFVHWWHDYERRTNQSEMIADVLRDILPPLGLDQARKLLSVGPASAKIEDILMQETLSSIETAYCVEPCPVFRKNFEDMMTNTYQVKTISYPDFIQDFEGTPEKVDLILITHVAYYFHSSFQQEMQKLMSLLTDGGAIVFATKDDNDMNKALVDMLPEADHDHCFDILPSVQKFRKDFLAIGGHVQEFESAHSLDISNTTYGDESYVSLLINRPVEKHEVIKLCNEVRKYCSPCSSHLLLKDKIFIVTK